MGTADQPGDSAPTRASPDGDAYWDGAELRRRTEAGNATGGSHFASLKKAAKKKAGKKKAKKLTTAQNAQNDSTYKLSYTCLFAVMENLKDAMKKAMKGKAMQK